MKKRIAILGSTGSIGKITLDIISKNKKNFEVKLLTTNKNIDEIIKQAKNFNVKNIVVTSKKHYLLLNKKKNLKKKFKIHNDFKEIDSIFTKKLDLAMSSITGIAGLEPTLKIIKHTKTIGIANKETIICGWNLILAELKKYKSSFFPIDSEHFSIYSLNNGFDTSLIDKIYITASGGPFLNLPVNSLNDVNPSKAINHPNWKMGKKISIDSATLINKVFEIIEAQRIFNLKKKFFEIIIHPKSYLHSIIKYTNGTSKLLVHDTTMKIPIFNYICKDLKKKLITKSLDFDTLNNLKLSKPNKKQFPLLGILDYIQEDISLFETVIVAANDELVENYLIGNIKFNQISKLLFNIISQKEFKNLKYKKPKDLKQIIKLNKYVRLKTLNLCIE